MKYEVLTDYPNSIFFIGQIIELVNNKYEWCNIYGRDWMYKSEFDEYPHIFKPLNDESKS